VRPNRSISEIAQLLRGQLKDQQRTVIGIHIRRRLAQLIG
jgi:hypothetical protein